MILKEMDETFSRRFALRPSPADLVRDSAPARMREAVLAILPLQGVPIRDAIQVFYQVVRLVRPSYLESQLLVPTWDSFLPQVNRAEWYEFYDFVEGICTRLKDYGLEEKINQVFVEFGIGWKLLYGLLETRGDEFFEDSLHEARELLKNAGRSTAASELNEAMADLSRRPESDDRGAIVRSVGALEALVKDLRGQPKASFGELINDLGLPKPLDGAASRLWGYASDQARHVREGTVPKHAEAVFVVQICAGLISFLSDKAKSQKERSD